ncbi:MAG: hypothetical protein WA399_04015 [Acidobacteriaceae bacterium]
MGFSCPRADRDDGGHLRASYQVCPREHDGAVQYCSPIKSPGPVVRKLRRPQAATCLNEVHNFIHKTIEVACSTWFSKTDDELELDRSNMIKREQLIAGVDATLSLGMSYVRPRIESEPR